MRAAAQILARRLDGAAAEPPVPGVYGHAGADRRLREVDRRDVAGLEEVEGLGEFGAERS